MLNLTVMSDSAAVQLGDSGDSYAVCSNRQVQVVDNESVLRQNMALFLIKTKEVNGVSQAALNELVKDVTLIVQKTAESIKLQVEHALARNGIQFDDIEGLNEHFQMERLQKCFCKYALRVSAAQNIL